MAVETVLSVGSNCGNRLVQVASGIEWLKGIMSGCRSSTIYSTADCHGGKRDYMNAVVIGFTDISADELNSMCKKYEIENGRTPESRICGDVPIDIDVVIYDSEIIRPNDHRQNYFQIGYMQII